MWIKEYDNDTLDSLNDKQSANDNVINNNEVDEEDSEKRNKFRLREIEEENKSKKRAKEKLISYKNK